MSEVSMWTLFAYMSQDGEGAADERRRIAEWQTYDVLRWALARGYDNIYFSRDPVEKTRFEKAEKVPVRHHMHVVEGSSGSPGGEAA